MAYYLWSSHLYEAFNELNPHESLKYSLVSSFQFYYLQSNPKKILSNNRTISYYTIYD